MTIYHKYYVADARLYCEPLLACAQMMRLDKPLLLLSIWTAFSTEPHILMCLDIQPCSSFVSACWC